ncbi:MAG: SufD family Fe-S cluster assembly protein [Spirochaetes bacterium]|nr:SufD family Fe-S cluster assembly protein [Spirochaetota bacterium]
MNDLFKNSLEDLTIDFSKFNKTANDKNQINSMNELKEDEINSLKSVGFNTQEDNDSGKFMMYGNAIFTIIPKIEGVEIIPLKDALEMFPYIKEKYYFKAVDKDLDDFTKTVYEREQNGYFIRVKKNTVVTAPLYTALFMHKEMSTMCIHNIVVLEEGAQLHLVTGCTAGCSIRGGLHIAASEYFIGKNAKLINTMIHNWGTDFIVRPRSATIVEENGIFISNYYSANPAKHIQTNPFTFLKGKNATAKYLSVILCLPDTYSNIGGTVLMAGENSGAELVARTVNHGGTVIQSGLLIGAAKDSRAHVDCSGLMLSDNGIIEAVPGLKSMHPDAKMSHEAAIGKIDMGEVNYLQSKGLTEMEAIALIVRGFLDIGIEEVALQPELEKIIQQISELSGHGD